MYPEDDWIMISALEHYSYCPRQYALIHLESVYHENVFTLRGRRVHERVHDAISRSEDGVRVERGLPLWSGRLGLTGVADVVEFWSDGRVYPVEYKSGTIRGNIHAEIQLCAQALCLEEMLRLRVPAGALYSAAAHRRREVVLDAGLRLETERLIEEVRALQALGRLPPPVNDRRCPNCSLVDACVPEAVAAAARRASIDLWRIPAGEPA